jgi:hypothetical protein
MKIFLKVLHDKNFKELACLAIFALFMPPRQYILKNYYLHEKNPQEWCRHGNKSKIIVWATKL